MILGKYLYVILGSALAASADGAKSQVKKRGGLRNGGERKLGYIPDKTDPTISVSTFFVSVFSFSGIMFGLTFMFAAHEIQPTFYPTLNPTANPSTTAGTGADTPTLIPVRFSC